MTEFTLMADYTKKVALTELNAEYQVMMFMWSTLLLLHISVTVTVNQNSIATISTGTMLHKVGLTKSTLQASQT